MKYKIGDSVMLRDRDWSGREWTPTYIKLLGKIGRIINEREPSNGHDVYRVEFGTTRYLFCDNELIPTIHSVEEKLQKLYDRIRKPNLTRDEVLEIVWEFNQIDRS